MFNVYAKILSKMQLQRGKPTMPFVKETFHIPEPIKAFVYVMKTLGYTQGEAQRHIGKGRILMSGESMRHPGA